MCVTVGDEPGAVDAATRARVEHHALPVEDWAVHAAVDALPTTDLWEVAAAVPFLTVRRWLAYAGRDMLSPLVTGLDADMWFAGGHFPFPVAPAPGDAAWRAAMEARIAREAAVGANRPVPDFYARLGLPEPVRAYATLRRDLDPSLLWVERDGAVFDKAVIRHALELLTGWADLAWVRKDPMQSSAGVFAHIEGMARADAAQHSLGYSDPLTEPAGMVASREFLRVLTLTSR